MTQLANAIILAWFFPATLFIIIPLCMLIGWLGFQLLKTIAAPSEREVEVKEPFRNELYTGASA
ncbi:MAG: hypothetical protein D6B25_08670 [Desulfobulbaceae bacterium]|nr:MAG: hypothetical protein D6B25_08670 [Desulfobulbaceae bacterium]